VVEGAPVDVALLPVVPVCAGVLPPVEAVAATDAVEVSVAPGCVPAVLEGTGFDDLPLERQPGARSKMTIVSIAGHGART
jgi:hypothetical protein